LYEAGDSKAGHAGRDFGVGGIVDGVEVTAFEGWALRLGGHIQYRDGSWVARAENALQNKPSIRIPQQHHGYTSDQNPQGELRFCG